jgi:Tfp pilus assembly protein PilO
MKGLTPIILILVSVGVFFFFIDPQKKELNVKLEEKNKNEVTMQKATELRVANGALNESYKKISKEERAKLSQILPDTVDNVRLILDINNIATKYGILLKGISISGGPADEGKEVSRGTSASAAGQLYGTIQLSFSFSASYDIFKLFVKDLEDSLRLVDITDISIGSSEGDFYNYSITLNTYWLR